MPIYLSAGVNENKRGRIGEGWTKIRGTQNKRGRKLKEAKIKASKVRLSICIIWITLCFISTITHKHAYLDLFWSFWQIFMWLVTFAKISIGFPVFGKTSSDFEVFADILSGVMVFETLWDPFYMFTQYCTRQDCSTSQTKSVILVMSYKHVFNCQWSSKVHL